MLKQRNEEIAKQTIPSKPLYAYDLDLEILSMEEANPL